jgi:hypothetical protein
MEILRKDEDLSIVINKEQDFQTNLGWQENMVQFEDEVLSSIINPIENYETVRYIHSPYTCSGGVTQTDIWFYFYFIDNYNSYNNGLDYNLVGITSEENAKMLKQSTESFFRLEFFKTPNDEVPTRINRKLVFAKNLSLPLGEKFFYTPLRDYVHLPVFKGSNVENKENMYLFWFQDDSVLSETTLTGNTFWVTAKFFNAKDGNIIDFVNSNFSSTHEINESDDMYYKVVIDKSDYSYQVSGFTGTVGNRTGTRCNPIVFYEKGGTSPISPTPTPTITNTPTPTVTPTPSVTPTVTMSPSAGSSGGAGNFVFVDFYFSLSYGNVGTMDIYKNGTYVRRLSFDGENTQVRMNVGDTFYCQLTHNVRYNVDDRGTISSLVNDYVVDYRSTPGGTLPTYATSDLNTIVDGNTYSVYGACGGTENLMAI